MQAPGCRRRYLGMVDARASVALLADKCASRADGPKKADKPDLSRNVEKGRLKEALELAIRAAHKAAAGADRLVQWTLKEITGRDGGIAGFSELTVTIEATVA